MGNYSAKGLVAVKSGMFWKSLVFSVYRVVMLWERRVAAR